MIKKIIKFLLVLVFTWSIIFLARQDVNTFSFWFACVLGFMYVDIAYTYFVGDGKTSEKITEGEDIKLVDLYADSARAIVEAVLKKHDSKYFILCDKNNSTHFGLFVEKNDDGTLGEAVVFNKIVKNENTYSLFQYDKFPLYVLETNDNGKIIGVNKINNKYVQV